MEPMLPVSFYRAVFILLFSVVSGERNLCSLSKLDNTCRCEYRTCEVTHFPELYADCRWIELDTFPQPSQLPEELRHLDLSHNNLGVLSLPENVFTPLSSLQNFNLGYNDLGKFFNGIRNIFVFSLNLDKLEIKTVPSTFFGDVNILRHLSLADNLFDDIPRIPSSVRHFDFSGNNVTILTVQHLDYHDLQILHLNRMKNLQAIDKYALYNMPNLEELYIESCPRLRELDTLAFGVIRPDPDDIKLKRFSVARSSLQSLNQTYMHLFKRLDYIDLQSNPFICDCNILWMQLLNGSFHKSENMRCASPLNLRSKKIMDLTAANLPNCLVSPQDVRLQKILIPVLAVVVMLLLVLIVYLIYMGPFIYKTYRGVGPESPYQEVTMLR